MQIGQVDIQFSAVKVRLYIEKARTAVSARVVQYVRTKANIDAQHTIVESCSYAERGIRAICQLFGKALIIKSVLIKAPSAEEAQRQVLVVVGNILKIGGFGFR